MWWDGTKAKWKDIDANIPKISQYLVRLFKGSDAQGTGAEPVLVSTGVADDNGDSGQAFEYDFSSLISSGGAGSYTFKVMAHGTSLNLDSDWQDSATVNPTDGTLTVGPLTAATGLWWDGNTAKWSAAANASGYTVQLKKGASTLGTAQDAGTNTYFDFTTLLAGASGGSGSYTFTVTAVGSGVYTNSPESSPSYAKVFLKMTTGTSAFGNNIVKAIAYGNSKYVAVGSGGTIATSSEGTSWTAVDVDSSGKVFNGWGSKPELRSVVWGTDKFVAVGQWGTIIYSSDGETWSLVSSGGNDPFDGWGTKPELYAVAWGGSKFVLAGEGIDSSSGGARTAHSSNGTSWTYVGNASAGDYNAIHSLAYGGDKFIAVGNGGRTTWSTDGSAWTSTGGGWVSDNLAGIGTLNAVVYGNSTWVAVSNDGKIAYTTGDPTDNANWTALTADQSRFGSAGILSVVYGNGKFVAVGHNGKMATSPDGIEWTAIPAGTTNGQSMFTNDESINAVCSNGSSFITGGNAYSGNASKFAYSD
jgi:hypothetical protein